MWYQNKILWQEKRPRIQRKLVEKNLEEDELEFRPNKCTQRARKIISFEEYLTLELWYDQHYIITRHQLGEDSGEKRDGISPTEVEPLIRKSIPHLICYSAKVKGFHFLNYENSPPLRIVLQDSTAGITLNVIVEIHYVAIRIYEITVKTAMRKNGFYIENGRHAVQFVDEALSILKKQEGKLEKEISTLEL